MRLYRIHEPTGIAALTPDEAPDPTPGPFEVVVRVRATSLSYRDRAITAHAMRPVIDRVFDFDDARAAYEHLASGTHFGKVVIRV